MFVFVVSKYSQYQFVNAVTSCIHTKCIEGPGASMS